MKPSKSFSLALNFLLYSKLRSWLTIIGIVIGVASVVAILSLSAGLQQSVESKMGAMGADIITITPSGGNAVSGLKMGKFKQDTGSQEKVNLTIKDIQALKGVANVAYLTGTVSGQAEAYYLGEVATLQTTGYDLAVWKHITTAELASGRELNIGDYNSVVIGSRVASGTYKKDIMLNQVLTIEGKAFKVVGILKQGTDDSSVIMSLDAARSVVEDADEENFNSIVIKAESGDIVEDVASAAEAKLMISRHVDERTKDFSVTTAAALQASMSEITDTMTIFLGAIAAVSLLVGAIGIMNTMFTSTLEKTKEIGIMKAIGARNRDIMSIFLFNAALVGGAGGLLGALLGTQVSMLLPSMGISIMRMGAGGSMVTSVSPELFVGAVLFSVLIGIVAGAVPAYQASKLKPVDALRYE